TPLGSSQIAPRRSDHRPKSGCTSELESAEASISTAASVYESENLSTRNGSIAGRAPAAKSTAKCPPESAAIARLSISARTSRQAYRPPADGLRGFGPGQVAADQRRGELALEPGDLAPIAFESRRRRVRRPQQLAPGDERCDPLQQGLHHRVVL